MSYLVLARKYRPRTFEAMVGQEHVVRSLANALEQQRLHHAYMFTGTRGVGKTTVSRILAKSLNCTGADGLGGITAQPCGVCQACTAIDSGRYVDYVELDAASNRGVDEITQLLDQAVYKPVMGRFKVYMVDEVHMLSTHAFNAMLKTLEEPPDYLKFVLATTDPQKVPPTVLSRCLQFNLRPMAAATVEDHLAKVLGEEQIPAEAGALRLLARSARGSMRDALSLTDQAIAFGAGSLSEAGVRQMLGGVDRGHAVDLLKALAGADGAQLLAVVDRLRELGLSAVGTLEEVAGLLQQMAVLQAVAPEGDQIDAETAQALQLAGQFERDETALLYSMCLHGRAELGLAPDEYGGLVMVVLRMLAFRPQQRPGPAAGGPTGAARPSVALQAPKAAKAAVPVAAPARTRSVTPATAGPVLAVVKPAAKPAAEPVAEPRAEPRVEPVAEPMARAAPIETAGLQTGGDNLPPWLDAPESDSAPEPGPIHARLSDQAPPPGPPAAAGSASPSGGGVAAQPNNGAAAASTTPARLATTELGDRWAAAVEALIERGSISAIVRELAWQAQCISINEPDAAGAKARWRLRVEREMLRAPAHCERLQAALADWLQAPVELQLESGATDDTPALRAVAARQQRQQLAEQVISQDPLVRSLLEQFKTARIVPGSIQPGQLPER